MKKTFLVVAALVPTVLLVNVATAAPTTTIPGSFGTGTKIVGTDVSVGRYMTTSGSSCYWGRLRGFGGTVDEIIANDFASGSMVVQILSTDVGFMSSGCGTWTK